MLIVKFSSSFYTSFLGIAGLLNNHDQINPYSFNLV